MQKVKNIDLLHYNGISALSFSKNGVYCAVGTKKNLTVYVFQIKTLNDINSWVLLQQMTDHTQTISEIDWSVDQKILTASHDRSVFVWRKNGKKWQKMLVSINVKLSVMACKWAASCKKFALGSCPSSLIIGFYSTQIKGWTANVKDKIANAPIISLDFHPSCNVLAIGSIDGTVKIVTCSFKKSTDSHVIQSKVDEFPYQGPFQKIDSFGEILFTLQNILPYMKIWINYVSFQNNGNNLLVLTHSKHAKFYDVNQGEKALTNGKDISHKGLPFANGLFNAQKQELVLAGYDRKVSVFNKTGDSFNFDRNLQKNQKANKLKTKGVVQIMLKGIQKKDSLFGQHPKPDEHVNTVKVTRVRNSYVSFDINGIVHFWE